MRGSSRSPAQYDPRRYFRQGEVSVNNPHYPLREKLAQVNTLQKKIFPLYLLAILFQE